GTGTRTGDGLGGYGDAIRKSVPARPVSRCPTPSPRPNANPNPNPVFTTRSSLRHCGPLNPAVSLPVDLVHRLLRPQLRPALGRVGRARDQRRQLGLLFAVEVREDVPDHPLGPRLAGTPDAEP